MYNSFTWVETRAKSKLRVRLVPLNIVFLFTGADFVNPLFNVKNLAITPYCGVCVVVGGGGVCVGGGGGVKTL